MPLATRTVDRCFFSWAVPDGLVMMRLARSCKHLTIPRFTDCGWCESYARYWSVCVGFLYTLVCSLPSGSLVTRVSRKTIFVVILSLRGIKLCEDAYLSLTIS